MRGGRGGRVGRGGAGGGCRILGAGIELEEHRRQEPSPHSGVASQPPLGAGSLCRGPQRQLLREDELYPRGGCGAPGSRAALRVQMTMPRAGVGGSTPAFKETSLQGRKTRGRVWGQVPIPEATVTAPHTPAAQRGSWRLTAPERSCMFGALRGPSASGRSLRAERPLQRTPVPPGPQSHPYAPDRGCCPHSTRAWTRAGTKRRPAGAIALEGRWGSVGWGPEPTTRKGFSRHPWCKFGGFMKAQGQDPEQQELLPGWEGCLALSGRSGRAPSGFPVSKKTHRLPGLLQTLPSSR